MTIEQLLEVSSALADCDRILECLNGCHGLNQSERFCLIDLARA